MHSGPLDLGASYESGHKLYDKNAAAQGAGSTLPLSTRGAASAQVELEIVAANLSAATSATSAVRADDLTSKPSEDQAPPLFETRLTSAASVALSARAQRLALIPAQVMDAEQLAEARKDVAQAQEELARVRASQEHDEREATLRSVALTQKAAAEDAQAFTNATAERVRAESQFPRSISEPNSNAASSSASVDQAAFVSPASFINEEGAPTSRAPRTRPDPASLLHGRSPFESSSPGSTGQSLDIVVGSPGE